MHVAYVCADRGVPIGGTKGASIHVRGVVQALDRLGHSVSVLGAHVAEELTGRRIETFDFGFDRTLKDLKRVVQSEGGSALSRAAHLLVLSSCLSEQLTAVEGKRPMDAIYERYSLFSFTALRFARERGIPFGLEVNAPLVEEQTTYRELSLVPVATAVEKLVIQKADVVFVPSQELGAWIESDCGRTRRTMVVPNGVDINLFSRASLQAVGAEDPLADRFVLVFVGSLKPWHGIDTLMSSFSRLRSTIPNAHLLVVGDGPMRDFVEEAADRVGRDHITLTGNVPHEEIPQWLARAHVAVAPYPALESFYFSPLKIVEYQAAGLPVVASRIGHVERQIDDGKTGLLVKPGDDGELERAVVRLFEDPSMRRRIGQQARRRAIQSGSWDSVASRVAGALERVAASKKRLIPVEEAR